MIQRRGQCAPTILSPIRRHVQVRRVSRTGVKDKGQSRTTLVDRLVSVATRGFRKGKRGGTYCTCTSTYTCIIVWSEDDETLYRPQHEVDNCANTNITAAFQPGLPSFWVPRTCSTYCRADVALQVTADELRMRSAQTVPLVESLNDTVIRAWFKRDRDASPSSFRRSHH